MSADKSFKDLFGMKQQHMALLLQVPQSQWGMYVAGQRNLPVAAKLKLADMLGFLEQETKSSTAIIFDEKQALETKNYWLSRQGINTFKQMSVKKKQLQIQNKHKTAAVAFDFIDFLENQTSNPNSKMQKVWQSIKEQATMEMQKNGLLVQTKLQLQLDLLLEEQKWIDNKLKSG